ncbi:hypothetical protein GCM10022255_065980 [Dactylosporangium darangshiense]|uniref:Uncharacterized protein n=1 Tax=Dactylosporangium darangshiense TaxID=579108 RepID=A0ABP8DH10_9ACTN
MYGRTAQGSALEAAGALGVAVSGSDGGATAGRAPGAAAGGALSFRSYPAAACAGWALAPRSVSSAAARTAAAERVRLLRGGWGRSACMAVRSGDLTVTPLDWGRGGAGPRRAGAIESMPVCGNLAGT